MKKFIVIIILILLITGLAVGAYFYIKHQNTLKNSIAPVTTKSLPTESKKEPENEDSGIKPIEATKTNYPQKKLLTNDYQIFQTFNNCGPAALSMALSYSNINVSQKELGKALRPYQNPNGDNDDKSVTLAELAEKSKEYNLRPYHRPNGNLEIVKFFINNNIPVITRTWLKPNDDIGHFRIIKGYDDAKKVIIQDDSLQGKNLEYSYDVFNDMWQKFNYEYLVLVKGDTQLNLIDVLKEDLDVSKAWKRAATNLENQLELDPQNIYNTFNLSVAYYNIGEYQKSVTEFEKIENKISRRTLWYQIEPIQAYYEIKNYNKVFELTNKILKDENIAFSELYIIRGKIYLNQNQKELAKTEFDKAKFYRSTIKLPEEAKDL